MFQCTVIPRLPKRWGFDPLAKEPQNDNQKSIRKQLGGKVTCRNRRNKVYTTQFHKLLQMQNSEVLLTNRPSPRKITILDRNQFRQWLDAQPKANPNWFSSAQSFYFNFPLLKAQFKGRSCLGWILQPTATPRTAREFVPQQFVWLDTRFPQRGRGRCPIPSRVRPGGCHPVPPTGHNLPPHLGAKRFTTAPNSSLYKSLEIQYVPTHSKMNHSVSPLFCPAALTSSYFCHWVRQAWWWFRYTTNPGGVWICRFLLPIPDYSLLD